VSNAVRSLRLFLIYCEKTAVQYYIYHEFSLFSCCAAVLSNQHSHPVKEKSKNQSLTFYVAFWKLRFFK